MNLRRIGAVIGKEGRELWRDPVTVWLCFTMPLIMLFLFGYAVTLDIDNIAFGVMDRDKTPASRELIERFTASRYFDLREEFGADADLQHALERGTVKLAVVIEHGFQRRLVRGETQPVQIIADGSYSATSLLAASYAEAIIRQFPHPQADPINVQIRVWYNPSLRSTNYIVPGLYGVILMAFPPLLTALAIVREKELGTIQQIYASPLTSAEFILGKLVPYGIVAFIEMLMIILVGYFWFGVPFAGSPWLLLVVSILYVLVTVGIGLLVSTIARTQIAAMLIALIVALMPSFLFSGFLFPVFSMPLAMQFYAMMFPTNYFVDFSRAVVLKGSSLRDLWPNIALLSIYTVVVFAIAARLLRKRIA